METDNKEELITLINYLIHHNEHHNEELEELASNLKGVNEMAYLKVKDAIETFKNGNASLADALAELNK